MPVNIEHYSSRLCICVRVCEYVENKNITIFTRISCVRCVLSMIECIRNSSVLYPLMQSNWQYLPTIHFKLNCVSFTDIYEFSQFVCIWLRNFIRYVMRCERARANSAKIKRINKWSIICTYSVQQPHDFQLKLFIFVIFWFSKRMFLLTGRMNGICIDAAIYWQFNRKFWIFFCLHMINNELVWCWMIDLEYQ